MLWAQEIVCFFPTTFVIEIGLGDDDARPTAWQTARDARITTHPIALMSQHVSSLVWLRAHLSTAKLTITLAQVANGALLGPPPLFVTLDLHPFRIGELGERLGGFLDCGELRRGAGSGSAGLRRGACTAVPGRVTTSHRIHRLHERGLDVRQPCFRLSSVAIWQTEDHPTHFHQPSAWRPRRRWRS